MDAPQMAHALETLRRYFGHDSFRRGQEAMVGALLSGRDALGVMPTGAGKSICYQVPALLLEGVTLVISPLISLMADQVAALKAAGVPAAYLNSTLTPRQMELALERARQGAYRIIYVAPERLETAAFLRFATRARIALIAVDEAHCVSQWGQDFRPVYLRIADFVAQLPSRPVMGAFTATATERVKADIVRHLMLANPVTVTTGFDRPNLYFEVVRCQSVKRRDQALLEVLRGREGQSGIVYCATRKAVEDICDQLNRAGIAASRYHAGLSDEERRQNQEDFQYDRVQVMVATNAFGMGIDKSNVRFVIHYQMPRSMEAYYQEAGRAGRDGERAECILLYNGQDIITAKWLIEHNPPNEALSAAEQANVRRLDMNRLQSMIDYCTKDSCLRAGILRYFGERVTAPCGDCGHCTGGRYARAGEGAAPKARRIPAERQARPVEPAPKKIDAPQNDLMGQLKATRTALAKAQGVPPYIVCSDATLASMCRIRPQTRQGMLSVSGMGEIKTARYGDAFLRVIKAYTMQEKKMRSQVAAIAREAQSAALRKKGAPATASPIPRPAPLPAPELPSRPPLENTDEDLADAYLSGMTVQQMADELGLSAGEVRQRLIDLDLIF
ncbi:MAG: RecQ family ATP-dependent DNA helicase [Clostridiales bacterium]|nr:RecQ family ATP-dependent DNA helicase [Clostridiales bacterium]